MKRGFTAILGIRNACAANGCLRKAYFPNAPWEKVDDGESARVANYTVTNVVLAYM